MPASRPGSACWSAAGVAALIALALGYPFFRLRGHYFTIATIVVAETGLLLVLNWDFAGGAQGIQIPYGPDSWAHLQFARDKLPYIYFALGLAVLTWLVTFAIEDSKWGYWWRAVKDNAEAAESLGVVVFRSKMAAAALSAFFTAIGGSFYAAFVSYIDPDSVMGFQFSLLIALPAVLGGIGTLWGPALGALVLIPLTELTRSSFGGSGNGLDLIIYGVLIMVISLARPEGLTSLFARRRGARAGQKLEQSNERSSSRGAQRDAPLRRARRQQRCVARRRRGRDPRPHRPERRGEIDALQPRSPGSIRRPREASSSPERRSRGSPRPPAAPSASRAPSRWCAASIRCRSSRTSSSAP